jgi:hypothetical protein
MEQGDACLGCVKRATFNEEDWRRAMVQDPGKPAPVSPPAKSEQPPGTPAKASPPGQDPAKTDPAKTDPTKTDTAKQEPGKTIAPDKTALGKIDTPKAEATKTDQAAPENAPVIPLQPQPGAIAVPPVAPAPEGFRIGSILIPALWLVGILVVGALLLAWLKKRRENTTLVPTTTASEQLATFRHAYEEGEMTPEEFKKVKARLSEKLREQDPMSMPPQAKRRRDGDPPTGLPGDEMA